MTLSVPWAAIPVLELLVGIGLGALAGAFRIVGGRWNRAGRFLAALPPACFAAWLLVGGPKTPLVALGLAGVLSGVWPAALALLVSVPLGLVPAAVGVGALLVLGTARVEKLRLGSGMWLTSASLAAAALATPDVEPTVFAAALLAVAAGVGSRDFLGLNRGAPLSPVVSGALASWAVVFASRGRPAALVGAVGCFALMLAIAAVWRRRELAWPTALWVVAAIVGGGFVARHVGLFDSYTTPLARLIGVAAIASATVLLASRVSRPARRLESQPA